MKAILLFLFTFTPIYAADGLEQSPRYFMHILDYIAVDYAGAVENGKIINDGEYKEQLEFADTVIRLGKELPELKGESDLHLELALLKSEIAKKVDAKKVSTLARKISQQAVARCSIQITPSRWPSLHNGKQLYDQNCAQCHGQQGRGDGPSGGSLDPKPADFYADKMDELPPFQLFNAIRLGVPGTAMASFTQFSDAQTWDLAFYVSSLRHEGHDLTRTQPPGEFAKILNEVSTKADGELRKTSVDVAKVRLVSNSEGDEVLSLTVAENRLQDALADYRKKAYDSARSNAIIAYLDGIEPVEPRLRSKDYAFTQVLEKHFADVRAGIEARVEPAAMEKLIQEAMNACATARELLKKSEGSALFTFTVAAGIFMREGFEAALILITLLGIVRSVGAPQAALSIHFGWISALVFGVVTWFFSGWVLTMSGAQREILEGIVSGVAVIVLLYFGFWLHRRTEIGRWRIFIQDMTRKAVSSRSLFALGGVAFLGVFRECFETVLFLRALLIESGPEQYVALTLGVLSSFLLVFFLSMALIKQSAKVPVRKLFQLSSVILVILSLILVGKMMHAFQETGLVGITPIPLPLRLDLLGVFPTVETLVSQLAVLIGIFLVVFLGNQLSSKEPKLDTQS